MMKGTVKEGKVLTLNLKYNKLPTDFGHYQMNNETKPFNLFDDRVATDFNKMTGEARMFDETLFLQSN